MINDGSDAAARECCERCDDLERQLAEERAASDAALAALGVVFAAGEESARNQLGLPSRSQQPPRRRGHLRSLNTVVLTAPLGGGRRSLHLAREETAARPL